MCDSLIVEKATRGRPFEFEECLKLRLLQVCELRLFLKSDSFADLFRLEICVLKLSFVFVYFAHNSV